MAKEKLQKALKGLLWLRWPALAVVGFVFAAVGAGAAFLYLNPPDKYRARAEAELAKALHAPRAKIEGLRWSWSPKDFSFGIEAREATAEGGQPVGSLKFGKLRISTQPFKLLFGKVPLKLVGEKGHVHVLPPAKATEENADMSPFADLPKWAAHLRVNVDLELESLELAPALVGAAEESKLLLKEVGLEATISGLPGHFGLKLESKLAVDMNQPEWSARGPAKAKAEGFFQTEDGKPVGVRIETFHLNLDHSDITGLGNLEKSSLIPLNATADIQVVLGPGLRPRAVEIKRGYIRYDELQLDLDGTSKVDERLTARWSVANTEVKALHLPVSSLRGHPFSGILETSGELRFNREGLGAGRWRVLANNVKFDPGAGLGGSGHDQAAGRGKITVSLMSEGSIDGGRFASPRTELQLDATEAELDFAGGQFRKPLGAPMTFLVKASINDDQLTVSRFGGTFHSMHFEGKGAVDDISNWINGRASPFKLSAYTNRIDLSKYATFLPLFRRPPPLEGFFEFSGAVEGQLEKDVSPLNSLQWRVDRMNLSNFSAVFDRESFVHFGLEDSDWSLNGGFSASLLFQGRGHGTVVDRALLSSQVDLTKAAVSYKERFRKPTGVPFQFDVAADQTTQVLRINRGSLKLHDLALNFDGRIAQGSNRSFVDLRMPRPVVLSGWKSFFLDSPDIPVDGRIQWKGKLGFKSPGAMEASLDWKTLSLEGALALSDLRGRFGGLRYPVRNGRGQVIFSPDSVTVPSMGFEIGGTRVGASAKLGFKGAGKARDGNISRLLTKEDWDFESAVTLSRLRPEDFEGLPPPKAPVASNVKVDDANPPLGPQIRALLQRPELKTGSFKVHLRSPEGVLNEIPFSDLSARLVWNRGLLQLQPFAVGAFGGKITGSAGVNAERFYTRKEAPEMNASFKADGVNMALAAQRFSPDFAKLVAGDFDGQLTFATQGWEADELLRAVKGRMVGQVRKATFETLQVIGKSIDSLIENSAARDYLMKEARKESCLKRAFEGDIDLQISAEGLGMEKAQLRFETGSSMDFRGRVGKDLGVAIDGVFAPGPQCIGGDARACLLDASGRAAIPFTIKGLATKPESKIDVANIAERIAVCAAKKVGERAAQAVRAKVEDRAKEEARKVENKARDAIKNILKGK